MSKNFLNKLYPPDQIGTVIQVIAAILFFVGVVASAVYAIYCATENIESVASAFCIFLFLSLLAYLPTLLIFGFGRLIQNSQHLVEISKKLDTLADHQEQTNENKQ